MQYNMRNIDNIIRKVIKEQSDRYMFFSNLEQMRRQCDILLSKNRDEIDSILDNGHDWAQDHIAEAKNNMDQVFDFLMNETTNEGDLNDQSDEEEMVMAEDEGLEDLALADEADGMNPNKALALSMTEGRKKAGTKLCARGKSAAKSKFKVYPSAYANGYAVQVCKGRMPGLDGKKKCSAPYC
jgi:dsDNA-specific endonuclease/ATPase MutS2